MPVGGHTKTEVRELARKLDLPVADKPESQDICFVPDNDYEAFLRRRRPELFRAGPVLDMSGNVLGQHEGIAGFTKGQRKGLGLAFGERRYVVRLEPEKNAVVLGTEAEAREHVVEAWDARWVSGRAPIEPFRAEARVRYQGRGGKSLVEPIGGGRVRVTFDEPQWAPTRLCSGRAIASSAARPSGRNEAGGMMVDDSCLYENSKLPVLGCFCLRHASPNDEIQRTKQVSRTK